MARRFYLLDMWISVERFFSLFDGERESLCRLESRDVVFGDDDGRVFGNVACSFGGTFLEDKTTKAAKINVLFMKDSTVAKTMFFSIPVLEEISFTISALVMINKCMFF